MLLHNLSIIRKLAPNSKILPMIKANAFGHGMIEVAKTIEPHVEGLAVARYDEAMELIKYGIKSKIVLMSGDIRISNLKELIMLGCDVVISSKHQFDELITSHIIGRTRIWLKINTGMNRLGIFLFEANKIIEKLKQKTWIEDIILMTHLSDAEMQCDKKTFLQCEAIEKLASQYSLTMSIANSAAIINYPQFHYDWVRPGIMLYGVSPIPETLGRDYNLEVTMELKSYLLDVRKQKKGDQIGYNSSWTCPEDMPLGIIGIGYGDGYPRNINTGTPVWINGKTCPIVGKVSMDLITVDLRPSSNTKIGDSVELWGKNLPVEIVAKYANTIPNELLTHISPRLWSYCTNN
jgi:alanine racemase